MTYTLITGASSGIGKEFARVFAQKGHHLILVARRIHLLEHLKKELLKDNNIKIELFPVDLANPSSAKQLFETITAHGLLVDHLINNAGVGSWGPFVEADWQEQLRLIQLNITTLTELTYLFARQMLTYHRGTILNISSTVSFGGGPYMALYYASKAYVTTFSEALAEELKDSPINIQVLCPGPTRTGFEKAAGMKHAKMFTWVPTAMPQAVAQAGYDLMVSNRKVKYHSANTHVFNLTARLGPRSLWRKAAAIINGIPRKK